MQTFKDTTTNQVYQFEDDVIVIVNAGVHLFETKDGTSLTKLPKTLVPYVIPAETTVEKLNKEKTVKLNNLVIDYQIAITKDITYNSVIYQADKASQDDLNVVLTGLGTNDVPTGFYWVAKDNSHNPFTKIDLTNLSKLLVDRGWTAFNKLQVAKGKVNGATDIASVDNVVY